MASDGAIRPSIKLYFVRHAESRNNQVYRDARLLFRGGTSDYDAVGWTHYVNHHRSDDPGLSETGILQAKQLAHYLVPFLSQHASYPIHILTSPMRRTLLTLRPTMQQLGETKANVLVHGFYHESEGCHVHNQAREGMNELQIRELLAEPWDGDDVEDNDQHVAASITSQTTDDSHHPPAPVTFTGFPIQDRGWYVHGTGAETRAQAEERASKFYLWLCESLDQQLAVAADDVFDAGASLTRNTASNGDIMINKNNADAATTTTTTTNHHSLSPRRRRTTLLMGHGDFMSLILKRIVTGFGHSVESNNVPHRSAFVHCNTGLTEVEYFGQGRFLLMNMNHTPHLMQQPNDLTLLRSGGSLADGWSYIMPSDDDDIIMNQEVQIMGGVMDDWDNAAMREQTQALKALYLSSADIDAATTLPDSETKELGDGGGGGGFMTMTDAPLSIEQEEQDDGEEQQQQVHFVVKRGLQVVGVATLAKTGSRLTDVAIRPSGGSHVGESLLRAVQDYNRKMKRSQSLLVLPRTQESKRLFQELGFKEVDDGETKEMELKQSNL